MTATRSNQTTPPKTKKVLSLLMTPSLRISFSFFSEHNTESDSEPAIVNSDNEDEMTFLRAV